MSHRSADASPAPVHRSAQEQARFTALLTDMFEQRISFNEVLGLRVQSIAPPTPSLRFDMKPELVGHFLYGRLHGGVKHPADSAEQVLQRFARMGTIDLRVDFLRQGVGKHFVASAEVTRLGGRVGSTQMRLVNEDGLLIATGAASYILA